MPSNYCDILIICKLEQEAVSRVQIEMTGKQRRTVRRTVSAHARWIDQWACAHAQLDSTRGLAVLAGDSYLTLRAGGQFCFGSDKILDLDFSANTRQESGFQYDNQVRWNVQIQFEIFLPSEMWKLKLFWTLYVVCPILTELC